MKRAFRIFAGWLGIFALVFAQLAVASYACPLDSRTESANAPPGLVTPCEQIDRVQANLCDKHCNDAEQSQASYPAECAGFAVAFTAVAYGGAPLSGGEIARDPALAHATGPPLSIQHCRFRI